MVRTISITSSITGFAGRGAHRHRHTHIHTYTLRLLLEESTERAGLIKATHTRPQHKCAPKRRQQDGIPSLDLALVRQTDPFSQRIRQHRHNEILKQNVREDSDADDEDSESA